MSSWRERTARWLEERWYGERTPNLGLRAVSRAFAGAVRLRQAGYRRGLLRSDRVRVPVIVVGNLAVGGTGKTPLVIALAVALQERGLRPGVISRGYGRNSGRLHRVRLDDRAEDAGDEPLLIACATSVPVAVAARRVEAARCLIERDGVDVLIADDGLQHYALQRDIEILVVDGQRRFGNQRMLPAGPLREPISRAEGCDFVVVNGGAAQGPGVPMRLRIEAARSLVTGGLSPLHEFATRAVHAVAGIAHPQRFFDALAAAGVEAIQHAFPDHYAFAPADLDFGDGMPVLMTEKDAVKCAAFAQANWYSVPVIAELPGSFLDEVAQRVRMLQGAA